MERAKKLFAVMLVCVLSLSLLPTVTTCAAGKVKLNKTKATIYVGRTVQLRVKNTRKKVRWSTSNKKVVTVTGKGKVKGKKTGNATVTAKVGKKKYKCKITVKKKTRKTQTSLTIEQFLKGLVKQKNAEQPEITMWPKEWQTAESEEPTTQQQTTEPEEPTIVPITGTEGKNKADVQILTNIINEQRVLDADVRPDLNSDQYVWEYVSNEDTDLRLVGISWAGVNLTGKISFDGLEELTSLNCGYDSQTKKTNQIMELDVRNNKELTSLDCSYNDLTELDVSNNVKLTSLNCKCNDLTELDVRANIELTSLDCSYNGWTELDVSNNVKLTYLDCECNGLTELDVSHNTELTYLNCNMNRLTELDVSHNTELKTLWCASKQVSKLDLSSNQKLTFLGCYKGMIVINYCGAISRFE